MIHLICQDWKNTTNNHAGIKHLCLRMKDLRPQSYEVKVIPTITIPKCNNKLLSIFFNRYKRFAVYFLILIKAKNIIIWDKTDSVVFMEYLDNPGFLLLSKIIHLLKPNIKRIGMIHLVPEKLDNKKEKIFKEWINNVDKIITLGSSLTEYLLKRGCERKKICTSYHYVDNEYYTKDRFRHLTANEEKLKIICMGNQMRNILLLKDIVRSNKNCDFYICQGLNNYQEMFRDDKNVTLIPFVEEEVLKQYMDISDISLNVMEDTIGSNVIVTSLAMGLAMICSNVGSIKDYCNDNNCIFCDNYITSFNKAISTLEKDRKMLKKLQENSLLISEKFKLVNFEKDFFQIVKVLS